MEINKMSSFLAIKNIGKVMKPWYKQIKAYSNLPYGIHTYDVVEGFSAKKGNFKIISYKNKEGKLLQRITSYPNKNEEITKNFSYDGFLSRIHTKINNSGKLTKNEYKTLCKYDDGSFVELTEQIGKSPKLDKQVARYLKPKHAPRVINIEDPWGACKITAPKYSTFRMTMLKDRQYLSTVISNFSKERVNQRINKIEQILANKNNISPNRTQTQRVSQKILNPQRNINHDVYYGVCDLNSGNVRVWNELYTTPDLYNTMGHEFNHSMWGKKMDAIFYGQTIGMGRKAVYIAKKLNQEMERIEHIPYLDRTIERLAFSEGTKVEQKFIDMFDNIVRFFER